jgi:L-ascorbate metabolism protein UlaG (beta-lactamase superfamily)
MVDGLADRRTFLRTVLRWGEIAAVGSLLSGSGVLPARAASEEECGLPCQARDYTLRELVRGKLHHGSDRFLNPFTTKKHGNMLRVLHWKLFGENNFKDLYDQEEVRPIVIDWAPIRQYRGLSITFVNHSSFMIKDRDSYILLDPVFFGLFRWIKNFSPLAFDLREMPHPDHVLVSHGHYDHLDTGSLAFLGSDTHVVTPLGYRDIFTDLGMSRRVQLDWFDTYSDGKREITLIPCNHWTMRNPFEGPNRSLWGSFILRTAAGPTIYLAADTAYFDRFEEIGREFSPDLAIINLGAYEPRWFMARSHMNPDETARAFKELKAKRLIIAHWGTFRLGDEPVYYPPIDIRMAMERQGLADHLVDLKHGETFFAA